MDEANSSRNSKTWSYKERTQIKMYCSGTILSRLYDSVLNERFLLWYKPNYEQAGFRSEQGCCNQIFVLMMLIAHAKKNKEKTLGMLPGL